MNMQFKSQESSAVPPSGRVVFSQKMHPIYDAVAEVRLMPDLRYQIFHHHGDDSFAWVDETAQPTCDLEAAIDQVHAYQRVFVDSKSAPVGVVIKKRQPSRLYAAG
ncbi:hypothetical protein [Paraburkholderia sp. J8-2]|uniref:hypothetical protein n=1 Tax=Paraburkholderia sp. J8-2 TaxID=2805440 RepID=UPI002AB73394|nr:hypothetical protein [Paraburkholderia sp. J8-2]